MNQVVHKLLDSTAMTLADRRQVVCNISSESADREGDIVVQEGIETATFMRLGGTTLWQHDPAQPIAKTIRIGIVNGRTRATVQFPRAGVSAKADEVFDLIAAGIINATSMGFLPKEWTPIDPREPWGAKRFLRVELLELSFVSIPANTDAAIIERSYRKSGRVLSGENAAALAELRKCLDKGERCHLDGMDSLSDAAEHFHKARKHAAAIALAAGHGEDPDFELAAEVAERKRMVEVFALAAEPIDPEDAVRRRMVDVLGLAVAP